MVNSKPEQPMGCEDFEEPDNAARPPLVPEIPPEGEGRRKGWDARRRVNSKPEQPIGCEDFEEPDNAVRPPFILPSPQGRSRGPV